MISKNSFCQRQIKRLEPALRDWFALPVGRRLQTIEHKFISELSQDLFGYYLLQLGTVTERVDYLEDCPVKNKIIVAQQQLIEGRFILADRHDLPIATDSVDAVILPHSLDFSIDPQQVLREVERVLIPDGHIIITGFNPFSLWGIWHLLLRRRGQVPWCGNLLSRHRIEDWLCLLGFDVETTKGGEFFLPIQRYVDSRYHEKINCLGQRYIESFGAIYAIKAVKRISRVTPIANKWRSIRGVSGRRVAAATRTTRAQRFEQDLIDDERQ